MTFHFWLVTYSLECRIVISWKVLINKRTLILLKCTMENEKSVEIQDPKDLLNVYSQPKVESKNSADGGQL